jgi:hypothetical protein
VADLEFAASAADLVKSMQANEPTSTEEKRRVGWAARPIQLAHSAGDAARS